MRRRLLDWLYHHLQHKLTFTTPAKRRIHACQFFHMKYTFILDGSEQPCLSSGDAMTDNEFYSAKKGKHTVTVLMITNIVGDILYLSPSFPGINTDNNLVQETMGAWIHQFENDENGIGDAGFDGLRKEGICIDTPPDDRASALYRQIASIRIRIEQKFAEIKRWRATKETLRIVPTKREKLLDTHHKYWTLAAVFVNQCATWRSAG